MKKNNNDVREAARRNGVYLYEIADALGKSEPTFNRWLRKEMNEKQKADAFTAIEKIAATKREEGNSGASEQSMETTRTRGLDKKPTAKIKLGMILFLCAVLRQTMTAQPLNCQEITNYVVVKTVFDMHFSLDNDIICDIMTERL